MADAKVEIERILTNGHKFARGAKRWKEKAKPLNKSQLKCLREFASYYGALSSIKGGTIEDNSVRNYLQAMRSLGKFVMYNLDEKTTSFEKYTKQQLIAYVKHIKKTKKATTAEGYRQGVVYFYKDYLKTPQKVDDDIFKSIKTDKKVLKKHILTRDEILAMLKHARKLRDKCIIMLTFGEGGVRGGELAKIKYGGLEFDQRGCRVYIQESKTRKRKLLLIDSEPYLREYINKEYAIRKEDDAPLFYNDHNNIGAPMLVNAFNELLKRIAVRAGITRRIYTHLGRHTAASILKQQGLTVDDIALRFGITPETVRGTYLHYDEADAEEAYLKAKGGLNDANVLQIQHEQQKLAPKTCARCNIKHPSTAQYCTCGFSLSYDAAAKVEEAKANYQEMMQKVLDDPIVQERIKTLFFAKN